MRLTVRVVSTAVLPRSRRKAMQGDEGDGKGCCSSAGVEGCCFGGSAEFLSIVGEGFAPATSFWLARISDLFLI